MKNKIPFSLALLILLAIFISSNIGTVVLASQLKKAPDFTLYDIKGKKVTLSSFKGKAVFLNFFATWCPPCREEMPTIQKLYDKLKMKGFALITVSVDNNGKEAVIPFIQKNGYSFPVLLDEDHSASNKYDVSGIPNTYFIDKKGNIVDHSVGSRDWSTNDTIKALKKLAAQ